MKSKSILSLILCIAGLISIQAQNRLDFLLNTLKDGGKSDYVMIFAHRGDWRNAPENSLQAYKNCINAGIDGIEIDVQMTKDSVIVMMHDNTIDRTTTGSGKVSDHTLAELKELYLKNPIGVVTRHKIPTFDEVLELSKGKILIQVDKWQPIKEEVIKVAQKHNCLNQLILRGTTDSKHVAQNYGALLEGVNYIPVLVCNGDGDNEKLDDFMNNIKTDVISLSFKKDNYPVIDRAKEIKERGFRVWYNSMWAEFNGGHDDEMAEYDQENSYGWLLEKGANIIFCDRPFLLEQYLKKKGKRNAGVHVFVPTEQDRALAIRNKLFDKNLNTVIVASHRGDWRNAPENSLQAIDNAINMGVDIVELDVQRTKDGQFILMHDPTLDRTTTGKGAISDWLLSDIKKLKLKNGCAIRTIESVPTLEEALLHAKGKIMVNLDKADRYFDDVYALMKKTGTTKQVIMKGNKSADEVKKEFGDYLNDVIYMPIVNLDKSDAKMEIETFIKDMQPVAFELLYVKDTNPVPAELNTSLKGKALIWYNTLWDTMAGGHDDDMSLEDPDKGYGYLIDNLGARIIQTDRPAYLIDYLRKRGLHD